jgi:rare lipoprotein A
MPASRLGLLVYWVSATALIGMIGSGVAADANVSPKPETVVSNVGAPATPAKPTAAAAPAMASTAPLAETQPGEQDPSSAKAVDQVGIASWYGNQHQGRLTASGERFDEHKLTAAHRTLPLDTKVKVTNLENGKSIEVKVNDRGPYIPGRVLDLSTQAAKMLGMEKEGLALVRIEIVGDQLASTEVN